MLQINKEMEYRNYFVFQDRNRFIIDSETISAWGNMSAEDNDHDTNSISNIVLAGFIWKCFLAAEMFVSTEAQQYCLLQAEENNNCDQLLEFFFCFI